MYWVEIRGVMHVFRNHFDTNGEVEHCVATLRRKGHRVMVHRRAPANWTVEDDAEVLTIDAQPVAHQLVFSLAFEGEERAAP